MPHQTRTIAAEPQELPNQKRSAGSDEALTITICRTSSNMGATLAVFLVVFAVSVAYLLRSAVTGSRSPMPLIVAVAIIAMATLGAWYAWAESRSLGWTLGYLGVALATFTLATLGWVRGGQRA
ncbi:MAG: hypothetical protein F9B45_29840 [Phycisphaera sp. RhM]|nr:hypothetical protein [Phycisphaera sp. RhM]